MSGYNIWWLRAKRDGLYQFNIIRSVFDWTIIVYLFIPAMIFAGIAYKSWWVSIPSWLSPFPYELFFLVCFFFSWQGGIRTFMEEADQLTLLQFPSMIYTIRYIGVIYSWGLIIGKWILISIWLYPLLNHFPELEAVHFYLYVIFFFSLNVFLTTYKQIIYRYGLLRKIPIHCIVFSFISVLVYVNLFNSINWLITMISFIFIIYAIWQAKIYQSQLGTFYADFEKEQRIKVKFISLFFAINPEVYMPKAKKQKKRSWVLWRHSTRILQERSPENGVTELFIKAFLRDKSNIFRYLQLLSVTTVIIFAVPIWFKWLVFIAFFFFFSMWIGMLFQELVKQNPYLSIDYGKEDYMFKAKKKCENRFVYPALIVVFLETCLSTSISIMFF
ncbi:ABC transporter permease [Bacillus sp. J37]|uniref:ABC transporter permease n=1 Tax=Bacillus sp. J37 TaxID=935837 RepID=UPI00047D537E|nr:ABC transporter permease [Bacillus sp. J37]